MMEQQEIIGKLQKIISPYARNQEALAKMSRDTDFIDDLQVNSAHIVDIVLDVEDEFDIEIDNESMEHMLTVGAAIDIVTLKTRSA